MLCNSYEVMEYFKNNKGTGVDFNVKAARARFKNVILQISHDNVISEGMSDSEDTEENRLYRLINGPAGPDHGYNNRNRAIGSGTIQASSNKRLKSSSHPPAPVKDSFVMKLFDRGVDLQPFNLNTPLYPLCRAWMMNTPRANIQFRVEDNFLETSEFSNYNRAAEGESNTECENQLPPPDQLPYDEYGNRILVRVPPPLEPGPVGEFNINYRDEDKLPSPAMLFRNHLDRWNSIKGRWKDASLYNDHRYRSSFSILRQMYEKSSNPENE